MTENSNTGQFLDVDMDLPFLSIVGTYPTDGDRFQTVQLSINIPLDTDLSDDPVDPRVKSWFTTFCTAVIAELRRPVEASAGAELVQIFNAPRSSGACGADAVGGR